MRSYQYRGRIALEALTAVEEPDPEPGPHEVVLRMRAAALNFRDLAIVAGHYHVGVAPPLVPLSDGAGEVVRVGAAVTRVGVGDLACPTYLPDWLDGPLHPSQARRRLGGPSHGVLTDLMCVHEEAVVRAPAHLDAVEAATLPVAAVTAWHALYQTGATRPGDTVLVQGSGGVSLAALQLARAGGARVIALTRHETHAARLRQLGASDVIARGAAPDWPAEIAARTGGRGVDAVVDVAGGASLARSIAAVRLGGRVHLVGYAADTHATIDIFEAIRHGVTIHVATAGSRESFAAAVRALEVSQARPPVDRVFPVSAIGEAFARLAAGGHFGKVVVTL